jgi:sugar phosphate isomerase/epimerase
MKKGICFIGSWENGNCVYLRKLIKNCQETLKITAIMNKKTGLPFAIGLLMLFAIADVSAQQVNDSGKIFERKNIVAWCIVPFDSKNRGPEERATMLNGLGITKLAYDWREKHIPTFDEELMALNKHHIKLQAFWMLSGPDPVNDMNLQAAFDFLERNKISTQIWYMFIAPKNFDSLSQERKVEIAAGAISYIAKRAAAINCTLGLYNHESWYGEPENQLAILKKLNAPNVGLVYNFNHAQKHTERFAVFFPSILPHLIALNLAGLKKGQDKIYPIGDGDSEQEMIRIVWKSKYRGPIGIINEDTDPDAETGLKMNMAGLKKILTNIGANAEAGTY